MVQILLQYLLHYFVVFITLIVIREVFVTIKSVTILFGINFAPKYIRSKCNNEV